MVSKKKPLKLEQFTFLFRRCSDFFYHLSHCHFCSMWYYPTSSFHFSTSPSPGPPSVLAKEEEVHSPNSTVAKERKDRIALAYTSSHPYLLCAHIYSSDGKDVESRVNKNKLRDQLKGTNCVKTIKSGVHANVYIL